MRYSILSTVFRRYPVLFAYLFGSQAAGKAGPLSDVDIAVYFRSGLSERRRRPLRIRLTAEICSALKRDDVDVVVLNDAPPSLAFRVTASGKVIFCRDQLARIRYEARAMSLY